MTDLDKLIFDIRAAKELAAPGVKRQMGESTEVRFVTDSTKILDLMERLADELRGVQETAELCYQRTNAMLDRAEREHWTNQPSTTDAEIIYGRGYQAGVRQERENNDGTCTLCQKPPPRSYCWAGKPEEGCPLGFPARWENEKL